MQKKPFISICIPAYKRANFLRRLLDSIVFQAYRDFEVVLTDDSPNDDVFELVKEFESRIEIKYYKNELPKGTPENWNEAIRKASGKWIKLMHDDDWFSSPASLGIFANVAKKDKNFFIFCSYYNNYLDDNKVKLITPAFWRLFFLRKNPKTLLSRNIIGPPSVTMHRNDRNLFYNKRLKWLVDIDFYVDRLCFERLNFISEPLINVGMSSQQVTTTCHGIADVEIPEYSLFISKNGVYSMKSIFVYDAWWRLIRNLGLTSYEKLVEHTDETLPEIIKRVIHDVNRFPKKIVRIGIFSKVLMFCSYLMNVRQIKK